MFALAHDHIDEDLNIGSNTCRLPPDALWCPILAEPMVCWHVIAVGRMLAVARGSGMGGDALPFKIYLNRACSDPCPQLLLQKLMRHRVVMAANIDMVIKARAALLPFGVNVRVNGQRLQRRAIQAFKQIAAAGTEMAGNLTVELIQQWSDGGVHLIKTKETLVAQPCQNPALGQQNSTLDLCLVFGLPGPRRNNGGIVMCRHIPIGAIDGGIIKTRLGDPGLEIVRDQLRRRAAEELKGADMAGYPVRQALRPAGFDIGVIGRAQGRDIDLRCAHLAGLVRRDWLSASSPASALVHELLEARDDRRLLRLQKQLAKYSLLIIDELGYVPLSPTGAELLFEVFSQRYERGSTIVTSNLPFDEWTSTFGSERLTGALLDRLTHHVHILEMNGQSFRLKQSVQPKQT